MIEPLDRRISADVGVHERSPATEAYTLPYDVCDQGTRSMLRILHAPRPPAIRSRRRSQICPLEVLEGRTLLAVSLSQLEGPAFAVVAGAIGPRSRGAIVTIDLAQSGVTDSAGRGGELLRVIAISDSEQVLPLSIRDGQGASMPSGPDPLGGILIRSASGPLRVQVRGAAGTTFHVYVSLAGDINGDYKVAPADAQLVKAGFDGIGVVPPGASPQQAHHARVVAGRLLNEIKANLGDQVALATPNLALGTRLVQGTNPGSWQIEVGGLPFYIQGATGDFGYADPSEWTYDYLNADITNSGVNTLRTYGLADTNQEIQNTSAALAWAASHSTPTKPMMILVGLYVPGVSASALESAAQKIAADPNASHILGWCVGNETGTGFYSEINTVAAYIHTVSTAPVMTAVPNVTDGALKEINSDMPNLDWLGINSFYGVFDADHGQDIFLGQLDKTMADGTWTKPWAVTEFYSYDLPSPPFTGYPGMPSQTLDGTPYYLELNSTANAENYAASWTNYIKSQDGKGNVGGFALNWIPPHNSQVPAFWKDMFVYKGAWQIYVNPYGTGTDRLEAVDAIEKVYGGTPPATGTPQIVVTDGDPQGIDASFKATLTSPGTKVTAGQSLVASVTAEDARELTFDWYLIGGTTVTSTSSPGIVGGPSTDPFVAYGANAVTSVLLGHGATNQKNTIQQNTIVFTMPQVPAGNVYQLRVIIRDGAGGAATAAIGFAT